MRLILKGTGCEKYVGFAKNKLRELKHLRSRSGRKVVPKKIYAPEGVLIELWAYSNPILDKIIITAQDGQILLVHPSEGGAVLHSYDYVRKVLKKFDSIASDANLKIGTNRHSSYMSDTGFGAYKKTSPVLPVFEDETGEITTPAVLASRICPETGREYVVTRGEDGAAIVYGRAKAGNYRKCAVFTVPTSEIEAGWTWLIMSMDDPRVFFVQNGFIYLVGQWGEEGWNLFSGCEFHGYNPDSGRTAHIPWYSDIWFDDSGNFGEIGMVYQGQLGCFRDIEARFAGLLDDRAGGHSGYGELMKMAHWSSAQGGEVWALQGYFYFDRMGGGRTDFDSNPHNIDYSQIFSTADREKIDFHYWSFAGDDKDQYPPAGRFGVIAFVESGTFAVHRFNGYLGEPYVGTGYITHCVSSTGNLIFVETTSGCVTIDLKKDKIYEDAEITGFSSACFISTKDERDPQPVESIASVALPEIVHPGCGEVRPGISDSITMGNRHWKMRTNGSPFDVIGFMFVDPCWNWEASEVVSEQFANGGDATIIVHGKPYALSKAPYIVGGTYDRTVLLGQWKEQQRLWPSDWTGERGRGDGLDKLTTEELAPEIIQPGAGVNLIRPYKHPTVYLAPWSVVGYPEPTLHLANGRGPVDWSTNSPVGMPLEPANLEDVATGLYAYVGTLCPGSRVDAVDSCERAGDTIVPNHLDDLTITGPQDVEVGDNYASVGGMGPDYVWTFDSGEIDNNGKILSVSRCTEPDEDQAAGTITVEDVCGNEQALQVNLPEGRWVQTGERWSSTCQNYGYYYGTFVYTVYEYEGAYTRWRIYFQSESPSNPWGTPNCDACETFMGWSCQKYVTFSEYFGVQTSSVTYNRIWPISATQYEWRCPWE